MLSLFIFSLFMIFYTFAGYPLLLWWKSRGKELVLPVSTKLQHSVDVVLIVCNEEKNVRNKINNILQMDYPQQLVRLIVVDDCSDDRTAEIVAEFASEKLVLLKNTTRSGKAHGLNLAMQQAKADLIFFIDARQKITLNALRDLSAWFGEDSNVGAVSGELLFSAEGSNDVSQGLDAYGRYERFIRSRESILSSVPGVSGAVYMLRRDLFKPIPDDTILDDVLIPMQAIAAGYSVKYDGRVIAYDVPSNDIKREKRRKTRTIKGNYQLLMRNLQWCIPFYHPAGFEYFSHKVTRLLAPFFTFVTFMIGLGYGYEGFLLGYLYSLAVAIFIAVYPLSYFFPAAMKFMPVKVMSAFVALNWFNLLGFFDYCFGKKAKNWK